MIGYKLAIGFIDNTDFFVWKRNNTIEIVRNIYKKYIRLYQGTRSLILLEKCLLSLEMAVH